MPEADAELDVRGLICPLPVLKTNKALKPLQPGQVLKVVVTDEKAETDIPEYCDKTGHTVLMFEKHSGAGVFWIRKG